jgi:hypothetical protein
MLLVKDDACLLVVVEQAQPFEKFEKGGKKSDSGEYQRRENRKAAVNCVSFIHVHLYTLSPDTTGQWGGAVTKGGATVSRNPSSPLQRPIISQPRVLPPSQSVRRCKANAWRNLKCQRGHDLFLCLSISPNALWPNQTTHSEQASCCTRCALPLRIAALLVRLTGRARRAADERLCCGGRLVRSHGMEWPLTLLSPYHRLQRTQGANSAR